MKNHQRINASSGNVEYYTPQPILEAARRTMGGIDLDPASSAAANQRVQASEFFTANGLLQPWHGRVWLNHPFGRDNSAWIAKLISEWQSGRVTQACCITFAATSEKWFQPLLIHGAQCFLHPRTNYVLPDGSTLKGVTKGSVVTFLGSALRFKREFASFGAVKV